MKLPISLLLLVALGHAATTQSTVKSSDDQTPETKGSSSKQDNGQTSKRELFEGNFGERKDGVLTKLGTSSASPGVQYAQNLKGVLPDQSPTHQIFGARLPQIAKISDVLTGQGPSFEAAVANHLYSPVSVYQARLSSPTLFEVPAPAASQVAYPNPKAYQPRRPTDDDKKLQELPTKEAELPRINFKNSPSFAAKKPSFNKQHFEFYGPKFTRQQSSLPQDVLYQPRTFSRTPASSLFPLAYDQLGPIRYQGDLLPPQFLHQQGVYHLLPVGPSNQEQNRGEKDYPNQGGREELQAEPTQRPTLQNIQAPKQGYHAHPNGAISFASFSQNLPFNIPQSQAAKPLTQQQLEELSSQYQALAHRPHFQKHKLATLKQKLQYTPISHKYIQQVPKYQPEPQFITLQQPIQNQLRELNPLHHLLFQDPPHIRQSQTIQFQRLPAFKPLPQSQLTAESFFQPSNASPYVPLTHIKPLPKPKPNDYQDPSTQNPNHIDQQSSLVSPQQNFTPLPPLKPNYNQYVKPLDPRTQTSPVFLPTPVQTLPTSTPALQLDADQLVSSTTIQPEIKYDEEPRDAAVNAEIQSQSPAPQPIKPEIIHQSQSTVLPTSVQSTTQEPFSVYEAQPKQVLNSSPPPQYQSTIHPQSTQTSPRHDVIIQQQELQELILEPSSQPSSAPNYPTQVQQNPLEQERQYQSQQLLTELDQLRTQEFQQGLQELLAQQYQQGARQLQYLQLQSMEDREPRQFENQHLEFQRLQPQQPTQQQQNEPEQSQLQLDTEQIQPQQYQKANSKPHTQIESTTNPIQEFEKQLEQLNHHQLQSQAQTQSQPQFKTTTGEPHEPQEKAPSPTEPTPTPDFGRLLDPILPFQPILPDIYAQPQELVTRPAFNHNFGAAPYRDVQYYGKYAETLFGH